MTIEVEKTYVFVAENGHLGSIYDITKKQCINGNRDELYYAILRGYIDDFGFRLLRNQTRKEDLFTKSFLSNFEIYHVNFKTDVIGLCFDSTDVDIDGKLLRVYNEPEFCNKFDRCGGFIKVKK